MADETPYVKATPVQERQEPIEDFRAFVDELRWTRPLENPADAIHAASVVLCELERRLTGLHRDVMALELPVELRRLLAGCRIIEGSPFQRESGRTFLADVADTLNLDPTRTFQVVSAVFTALRDRLSDDDVHWVANQLPPDLADIWRRPI